MNSLRTSTPKALGRSDVFSREKRSEVMSLIRSTNTRPERAIRALLDGRVFRYQPPDVPGSPDFASRRRKIAVFVDGCFWHGHPAHYRAPKSSRGYWLPKVARNRARDRDVNRELRALGWTVLRFWECQVRMNPAEVARRIEEEARRVPA